MKMVAETQRPPLILTRRRRCCSDLLGPSNKTKMTLIEEKNLKLLISVLSVGQLELFPFSVTFDLRVFCPQPQLEDGAAQTCSALGSSIPLVAVLAWRF